MQERVARASLGGCVPDNRVGAVGDCGEINMLGGDTQGYTGPDALQGHARLQQRIARARLGRRVPDDRSGAVGDRGRARAQQRRQRAQRRGVARHRALRLALQRQQAQRAYSRTLQPLM